MLSTVLIVIGLVNAFACAHLAADGTHWFDEMADKLPPEDRLGRLRLRVLELTAILAISTSLLSCMLLVHYR